MSDQDDTLLDEDLGDEEYDLGNDEEEALLADDYEIDRQNSYKGEEETDDVLELGVTDALDDLEGEDENVEYRSAVDSHNQSHCYNDERINCHGNYYEQEEHENYNVQDQRQHPHPQHPGHYQDNIGHDINNMQNNMSMGDLREKLQKISQRDIVIGNGQGMEDDDCDDARERRNRFQSERIMIPPKMNNEIPDNLENVVTVEQSRPAFRGRGRGRGIRGIRGGRFGGPMGMYNPRFTGRGPPFEDQKLPFRPPLLEARPPIFPNGPPNNMMNPQMIYHQGNPHPPRFQQFPPGPPRPPGGQRFNEPGPRPPFNQFQGMPPQGPRPQNPRMEFRPRPPGPPRFNGPPNQPQFMQPRPPHFQGPRPSIGQHDGMMPPAQGGPSLLGPGPHPMHPPGNPRPPMHPGHPRMHPPSHEAGMGPVFRPPVPNHGPPMANHPNTMNNQPFENRPPFQETNFEGRNMYGHQPRPSYNNQSSVNQFNSPMPVAQSAPAAVPNVPLPPGHKILINPHFRGTPQPTNDGRPAWDTGAHQPQTQTPSEGFTSANSYQDQRSYNAASTVQQSSQEYKKSFSQTKNDDPYAYFSDVWQENKTPKPKSSSPLKSYSSESNYSRDSYRDYDSKYKSESRDSYQEEPRYRDRSPAPRSRDYPPRSRPPPSNSHHSDSYDQRSSRPINSSSRPSARPPQKRSPEPGDRSSRDLSPKRAKSNRSGHETDRHEPHGSANNKSDDDLDPEMREYRKKMEEQRRLRERILQEKENRRKQAALDRQGDESKDVKSESPQQESKQAQPINPATKDTGNGAQLASRARIRPANASATEGGEKTATNVRIVRNLQSSDKNNTTTAATNHNSNETTATAQLSQTSARRVVLQKPLTQVQRVATSIQKKVSSLQKTTGPINSPAVIQKVVTKPVGMQKIPPAVGSTTRTVVKEAVAAVRKVVVNNAATVNAKKITASAQNSQRIVLQPTSTKPNTVIIENLAASTSELQIRKMCQGIGTLESITMGEGSATIIFKTHSAATVFHKKYQRRMIDLSMINVRLVSNTQTNINSAASITVKK